MADFWAEEWSEGRGRSRKYCGVAETEDGFAVDVFEGDTCVWSEIVETRKEAKQKAMGLKMRFGQPFSPQQVAQQGGGARA